MPDIKKTMKIAVASYMCDEFNRLTLSGFMDYAQDLAGVHADGLGFSNNELNKDGIAWIISRMRIHFHDMPLWMDEMNLTTWHKGREDGLFYRREFVGVKDGRRIVEATSDWLLLNLAGRQLVRKHPLCDKEETICHDNALEGPCNKIRMPFGENGEFVCYHEVTRSELDRNRHANNAKYADWVIDALPERQFGPDVTISDFEINFNHETRLKDQVELRRLKTDENSWTVEGLLEEHSAFVAKISFRKL